MSFVTQCRDTEEEIYIMIVNNVGQIEKSVFFGSTYLHKNVIRMVC